MSGRPLAELLASRGPLRGAEAQRLRGHFTSLSLHPADCDNFALVAALMTGRLDALKRLFEDEIKARGSKAKAVQAWNDCTPARGSQRTAVARASLGRD